MIGKLGVQLIKIKRPRSGAGKGVPHKDGLFNVTELAEEKRGLLQHVEAVFLPIDEIGIINNNSIQIGIPINVQKERSGEHRPPEPTAVQKDVGPIRDHLQIKSILIRPAQVGEKGGAAGEMQGFNRRKSPYT